MKKISRVLLFMMALTAILISACGGVATESATGTGKGQASLVEFTGVIEAIDGNQWTVGGQIITVDPAVLRDGVFNVGDTVKVEVEVQTDGSVVVTRVEAPEDADNTNDDNSNDDNSNDSDLLSVDDSQEYVGVVQSINGDQWVIGDQTFTVASGTELNGEVGLGSLVSVKVQVEGGVITVLEIGLAEDDSSLGWDDSNSNDDNSNDDNGNDDNSNDDNGNDDNSNDDNGNDDNSNDDNSNDDNDSNSNDD